MANEENLTRAGIEIDSTEKAQALGAKGGIASGITKRRRKAFKETIGQMLQVSIDSGMFDDKQFYEAASKLTEGNITIQDAMTAAQIFKAIKESDTQAFKAVVEAIEGKPKQPFTGGDDDDNPIDQKITIEFLAAKGKPDEDDNT
jgi:hypothetical protein